MAPLRVIQDLTSKWHDLHILARNVAITGTGDGATLPQAQDASLAEGGAHIADYTVYLGIGLGVGGAFLLALTAIAVLIVRKRAEHKRMIEAMEVEEALQSAQRQQVREAPRPVTAVGCSTLAPLQARAGWGALSSDETVNEPEPVARADKRKRSSVSLPKKLKRRGIPLKRLKRLTAILESPRSRNSPSLPVLEPMPAVPPTESSASATATNKAYNLRKVNDDDVFVCPGSPKPEVLPSFAIRSPGRCGAGIANNDNTRTYRSRSVGAVPPIPDDAVFGSSMHLNRPRAHARSLSLGAPPTAPPSGPVPPLPVIKAHELETHDADRQGICVARRSLSSQGSSSSSSALVATPILMIPEQDQPTKSPSVEDVVAQDESASLQTVSTKQWQNPLITGPRQVTASRSKGDSDRPKGHTSIRSNMARYSAESMASQRMSSLSAASTVSLRERFSLAQIGVADQISISRVSSENSLQSFKGVRKVTTPRKMSRTSVSENGSPAERKKGGILRDISGNSIAPSRQLSNATQDSSRSSNGNPFQLDQCLPKPSALKGSPNARKGHRRQNCVRISTLTPQILGPPPSRPTSPSIMQNIEEEPGDGNEAAAQTGVRFVSNHRLSRPSSASYSAPNLRLQSYRASLTPSSPTLSVWTAFQEHGLPSQVSDSQLSGSAGTRSMSRQSNCSSMQSIPSFPSPVKAAVSTTQLSQPIPEFYLSRPSTDINDSEGSSPFESRLALELDVPSSPPSSMVKSKEYDPTQPAWPVATISTPKGAEYDPASPVWNGSEPETSSAFFPFAVSPDNLSRDLSVSSTGESVPWRNGLGDTPPVSPKTMPEGFKAFFDKADTGVRPARASEKLTSANASILMADTASKVDFPGAPVLPCPHADEAFADISSKWTTTRQRAVSNAEYMVPMRPPPPPPDQVKDSCIPSPLHVSGKTVPSGPRLQPAQSVLKNAMALRRMNSEVNTIGDRESRRFVRLGREASPLLPWIGNPDPDASYAAMNELFDFDFATDAKSGADEHEALEEVDMTEMERRLDGALAGFGALGHDGSGQRKGSSSVWDDGERYWHHTRSPTIGLARDGAVSLRNTPEKQILGSPRSIQNTPKSLYDSDGFLKA